MVSGRVIPLARAHGSLDVAYENIRIEDIEMYTKLLGKLIAE